MSLQPVIEGSKVVDQYDDGKMEDKTEEEASSDTEEADASRHTSADQVVLPEQESSGEPEQPKPSQVTVVKEDPTDFKASDVKIEITLHRDEGHSQGRLVSVLIHNFSGLPIMQTFHEDELSEAAPLDSIQRAIYPVMQRFLLDLSARRQKKLTEEAKRAARPATVVQPTTTRPAATAAVPASPPVAPAHPPTPPAQQPARTASPEQATPTGDSKKKDGKQEKYQSISLF